MVTAPGLNDTSQASVLQEEMNLGSVHAPLANPTCTGTSWPGRLRARAQVFYLGSKFGSKVFVSGPSRSRMEWRLTHCSLECLAAQMCYSCLPCLCFCGFQVAGLRTIDLPFPALLHLWLVVRVGIGVLKTQCREM